MEKYKKNILAIILSLILVIFIWHKFLVSGNTVVFLLVLMAMYYFIKKVLDNENKPKCITTVTISIIFAIIEIVCTSINTDFTLNHIIDKWLVINFLGYVILSWSIISTIYTFFDNNQLMKKR